MFCHRKIKRKLQTTDARGAVFPIMFFGGVWLGLWHQRSVSWLSERNEGGVISSSREWLTVGKVQNFHFWYDLFGEGNRGVGN